MSTNSYNKTRFENLHLLKVEFRLIGKISTSGLPATRPEWSDYLSFSHQEKYWTRFRG
jgi:hypothetical protein